MPDLSKDKELHNIPILLVDDTQDNLDLLEALLLDEGFETIYQTSKSTETFTLLEENPDIGLILLDLMMPDMDGYEVCDRISQNPKTAHIPILIVTGAAFRQNEALIKSFNAGATDFLHKPLNEVELYARVRFALTLYRERKRYTAILQQLEQHKEKFSQVINQAPVGIAQVAKDGSILLANNYFCEILQLPHTHLQTHNILTVCQSNQWVDIIRTLLDNQSLGKEGIEINVNTETEPLWFYISSTPLDIKCAGEISHSLIFIIENITERREHTEKIKKIAYYDALTGLPNRVLFYDSIRTLIESRQHEEEKEDFSILFIDLDNFKNINDSLGHPIGDALLKSVAKQIQSCLRHNDLLARLGGDEFALLIESIKLPRDAAIVAEKILKKLEQPVEAQEHLLYIGASIGISIYPEDGIQIEELIKNADTAMYRAKELGKRTYQFFDTALDTTVQTRLDFEQELHKSLNQQNFILYYQPQVDFKTHKIISVEALIRWQHPTKGLLNPGYFLPFAEETALITLLDHWVIRQACKDAKRWLNQGLDDFIVYINLSLLQFQQPDFIHRLMAALEEEQLPAQYIGIEITENISTLDKGVVINALKKLQDIGIPVFLDDFGMGYSSLSHLADFPIQGLKIDKSFIQNAPHDEKDANLTKTIINLGQSFHLKIVAEGIEDMPLWIFAQEQGCDLAQGFFISRPQSFDEITHLLKQGIFNP